MGSVLSAAENVGQGGPKLDFRQPRDAPHDPVHSLVEWRKELCKAHGRTQGAGLSERGHKAVFSKLRQLASETFPQYLVLGRDLGRDTLSPGEMGVLIMHLYEQCIYVEETLTYNITQDMQAGGGQVGTRRPPSPGNDLPPGVPRVYRFQVQAGMVTYRQRKDVIDKSVFMAIDTKQDLEIDKKEWVTAVGTKEGMKRLQAAIRLPIMPM